MDNLSYLPLTMAYINAMPSKIARSHFKAITHEHITNYLKIYDGWAIDELPPRTVVFFDNQIRYRLKNMNRSK